MYTSENSKTKPEEVNQSSKNSKAQLKYQVQAKPVLKRSGENSKSSNEESSMKDETTSLLRLTLTMIYTQGKADCNKCQKSLISGSE